MPSELVKKTHHLVINPPKIEVEINEEIIVIKPMSDNAFATVAEAFSTVISSVRTLSSIDQGIDKISITDWISLLDPLIKALIPASTEIIASSLRKDYEFVEDNIYLQGRVQLLKLIFEAEGIKHIVGELKGLSQMMESDGPISIEQPLTQPSAKSSRRTSSTKLETT